MSIIADFKRGEILQLLPEYVRSQWPEDKFVPGKSRVLTNARVFGTAEVENLVDAALDFWLTSAEYSERFECGLETFLGVRDVILCNSGSSANLLAISALTSDELGTRQLRPGDEVITVAAGFPTTISGIVQNQLVPVFVDVELETYNIDTRALDEAYSERTRAIVLAHTLGHPFDLGTVKDFCHKHSLWLIEDNCDALGSKYYDRYTGTFGDLATQSFFPAHHITTGQGGAVIASTSKLASLVRSFRDWGRSCWCLPGKENTCGKRYNWQLGDLPAGYDHKYMYTHIGYNLEMTDLQAAIGCAQLDRLQGFIEARRRNWHLLRNGLADIDEFFAMSKELKHTEPSWFGFTLRVQPEMPFSRLDVLKYLNDKKIDAKLLFAGNLAKQPAYRDVHYRAVGDLINSDNVMSNVFWLGVYPGLSVEAIEYVIETMHDFVELQ